jgi:hypothetical protein
MVLTGAQTAAFFQEEAQIGIPNPTVAQMQAEGIANVQDLADSRYYYPHPAFVFGAKSQERLLVAIDLIKYYDATVREYTAANLQWANVMRNFKTQWKALKVKQREDPPETPKISKAVPVIKWAESFRDIINRVIGVRTIPLCYVIRETVNVPAVAPALAHNRPHSNEHESVTGELVARASRTCIVQRRQRFCTPILGGSNEIYSLRRFHQTFPAEKGWERSLTSFAWTVHWKR